MKLYKLFFLILTLSISWASAQFHELGVFVGGSNYVGDVGDTKYINPNSMAFGLLYKWNRNERYSFRAGINISNIQASDLQTNDLNRLGRQYQFKNNIKEAVVGIEINFVDFDLLSPKRQFSPYIFTGLGYVQHELFYFLNDNPNIPKVVSYGKKGSLVLPFSVGLKGNPTKKISLGAEIGVRYSMTDNIDGSDPINLYSENEELKFGNLGNNDWYIFTGLTISFTFGKLPCYCK